MKRPKSSEWDEWADYMEVKLSWLLRQHERLCSSETKLEAERDKLREAAQAVVDVDNLIVPNDSDEPYYAVCVEVFDALAAEVKT